MRKNDDIAAWRIFFRVVELCSISKVAEEMNVEPSSISRRLSALEQRIGTPLLIRSNRSIKLTDAGSQAYEKIRVLIDEMDSATADLTGKQQILSGLVRLSAPVSFGDQGELMHWLTMFQMQHPLVQIELILTNGYMDLLEENIDIALRGETTKDEHLITQPLGEIKMLVCASPLYLAQYGTPTHPSDLKKHRKLVYTNTIARGKIMMTRGHESIEVEPTGHMRINHLTAIHRAVLAGAGIHLVAPLWSCVDDLKAGRLVQLLPDWQLPTPEVNLIRLPNRHTPQRVIALSDWLIKYCCEWLNNLNQHFEA